MKIEKLCNEINDCLTDGTERTLYGPISNFITDISLKEFNQKIKVRAESSSKQNDKDCGFPDLTIKNSQNKIIGFIEVKLPKDQLSNEKFEDQFNKYKGALENIIFTNLKRWELYQWNDGVCELIYVAEIDLKKKKESNLQFLFEKFLGFKSSPIKSTKQLSKILAKKTKLLSSILEILVVDNPNIIKIKKAFADTILKGIDDRAFSNLVAESLTYSLFVANLYHTIDGKKNALTLTTAIDYIPKNIPVLGDLYTLTRQAVMKIPELDDAIDSLLMTFENSSFEMVASQMKDGKDDPIIYFYEEFLREYDNETKRNKGVYYTPKPLVDFIVRAVDDVVIKYHGSPDGLTDRRVKLLDPAIGTGTFVNSAIELIHSKITKKFKKVGLEKEQFEYVVRDHIMNNFFGFEFMLAPYTVSHLKLSFLLKRCGVELGKDERFKIYLANTLNSPENEPIDLLGFESITEESRAANTIKKRKDILAIVGNPPYSNFSVNQNPYISNLLKPYIDGLGEKKHNIKDDYIKFIRFSENLLSNSKDSVMSMVTNNSFLDGKTHRLMRQHLLKSFDKVFILNLHGNSKRDENDKNVFDIQIGVCIFILVKIHAKDVEKEFYYYSTLENGINKREQKFDFLNCNNLSSIKWAKFEPKAPNYYFVKHDDSLLEEYNEFWDITKIFRNYNSGIQTGRDALVIDSSFSVLSRRMKELLSSNAKNEKEIKEKYSLKDSSGWKFSKFKKAEFNEDKIKKVCYRPFDFQYIYYDPNTLKRDRKSIMKHLENNELSLCFSRQTAGNKWKHILVSKGLVESGYVSLKTREWGYVAPLYLINDTKKLTGESLEVNFSDDFLKFKKSNMAKSSNEEIFYYIYAILNSQEYQTRYSSLLTKDFPRIDFGYNLKKLAGFGEELSSLYMLENDIFENSDKWDFEIIGKNFKINSDSRKNREESRLYLNKETYITNVDDFIFNFEIGGYLVIERFLLQNNGKELKHTEILQFLKILVAICEIGKVIKKIDKEILVSEHHKALKKINILQSMVPKKAKAS